MGTWGRFLRKLFTPPLLSAKVLELLETFDFGSPRRWRTNGNPEFIQEGSGGIDRDVGKERSVTHTSQEELEQFMLKTLPLQRNGEVEEHLRVCPRCMDNAEALAMVLHFLRRAAGGNGRDAQPSRATQGGRLSEKVITLPVVVRG
jgi:hypothetical protein